MRRELAVAVFSVAMCLGSLAAAAPRDDVGSIDPGGDHDPSEKQVQLPPDPEGKAVELRLAGKCNEAIPILRRLSDSDDIADYNLGLCLIDVGKSAHDDAQQREGAKWILKAANDGLPNAQSSLVGVYLDGSGVPKDAVEAGKWSLLYQENGTRMAIGMPDLPAALQSRLDGALNDQSWAEAQNRASSWTPTSRRANDY
jgi:TPR repeat protein